MGGLVGGGSRQGPTTVTVSWFAGRTCKNHSKWYIYLPQLYYTIHIHYGKIKSSGKIRSIGVRYNHVDIHHDSF